MNIEDGNTKQAYLQMLVDTLVKKKKLLIELTEITSRQDEIIVAEVFDDSLFEQTMSSKEELLVTLNSLDDGFEKIYEGVKEELENNKLRYKTEITALQELITELTDLNVNLQAMEKRNKLKLDNLFSQKRKSIRESRMSNKTVSNYYRSMSKQQDVQSVFYDKKN